MDKWFIKNSWTYTLIVVFCVTNCLFLTKSLLTGDKGIIRAMIDIDQTIAKKGYTKEEYQSKIDENFEVSFEVLDNVNEWCLYEIYLVLFIVQKFFFTILTLSCAIPGGIFTPTFSMGAVLGQLYVSIL